MLRVCPWACSLSIFFPLVLFSMLMDLNIYILISFNLNLQLRSLYKLQTRISNSLLDISIWMSNRNSNPLPVFPGLHIYVTLNFPHLRWWQLHPSVAESPNLDITMLSTNVSGNDIKSTFNIYLDLGSWLLANCEPGEVRRYDFILMNRKWVKLPVGSVPFTYPQSHQKTGAPPGLGLGEGTANYYLGEVGEKRVKIFPNKIWKACNPKL